MMDELSFNKERLAAQVLSDEGISLPLRLLWKRKKHLRWVMRVPSWESKERVTRMYLKIAVTPEELQGYTYDQKLEFIARHTKTISRMVAYGIVRGPLLGRLLNRPVAWMLRSWMHPVALEEAFALFATTINTVPFENIIRLASVLRTTAPNLSHAADGS
ncbi:MAG: hypothetical protein LBN29_01355 [Mediterranea sp.]|jgi:hypothetical protein|nr:hypothetical protein [Mediterranea sp.]